MLIGGGGSVAAEMCRPCGPLWVLVESGPVADAHRQQCADPAGLKRVSALSLAIWQSAPVWILALQSSRLRCREVRPGSRPTAAFT